MIDQTFDIVRQNDPDRFLISLMMPRHHRAAIWAVFAFDIEIAKTKYVVTEAAIGNIRLQWWRDAISEIYAGQKPRRHEVVEPLARAIEKYDLPQELFENAIKAREAEFAPDDIVSQKCFQNYCLQTSLPIDLIVMKILGQEGDAYNTISQNFGMMRIVMTLPKQLSHGLLLLPIDLLKAHDLSCQKILDYRRYDELKAIVEDIVENYLVDDDKKISSKYYSKMSGLVALYKNHIQKNHYDLFSENFQKPIPFKAVRLWIK